MIDPTGTVSPQISVITPVFNRPDRVSEILTVLSEQTFQDWELIVVDDASTSDMTEARGLLDAHDRAAFIQMPVNGGPAAARNAGIAAAKGRFIAFLDSDDAWHPEKLARQHAALLALSDPDRGFCVTGTEVRYPGGQTKIEPDRILEAGERGAHFLYVENKFAQCSSFCLGAALLKGPNAIQFEERLRQYEDHLFFMAAADWAAEVVYVDAPLSYWINDARPDRLSTGDDVERGQLFVEIAKEAGLMTPREALAFELRCLGPEIANQHRGKALRLALRGAADRALPRDAWAKLMLAAVVGPKTYMRLREARR
ncbi:MAG: glycosyltransferase family A protein [Pseudomonadota bacterium]